MKAVIFDFDGTLTCEGQNVWRELWRCLTYDVSERSLYVHTYKCFLKNRLTYDQLNFWAAQKFRKQDFNIADLDIIANKIKLIDGFEETIKILHNAGFSLHIVSGGISDIIEKVIGKKLLSYFDSINANSLHFEDGYFFSDIIRTKYDFEGKATFIEEIKKTGIKSEDIVFIGNSNNDEWAHKSGCKTICINPEDTCSEDRTVWNDLIYNMTDLRQLLPIILQKSQTRKSEEIEK